jgi:hypothetical protein
MYKSLCELVETPSGSQVTLTGFNMHALCRQLVPPHCVCLLYYFNITNIFTALELQNLKAIALFTPTPTQNH